MRTCYHLLKDNYIISKFAFWGVGGGRPKLICIYFTENVILLTCIFSLLNSCQDWPNSNHTNSPDLPQQFLLKLFLHFFRKRVYVFVCVSCVCVCVCQCVW